MAFQEFEYRPAFGRTLAVVTVVVCSLGVVGLLWADAATAIRYVWPIILVAVIAWAVFWRPMLRMQEHGITIENVFRTYFVPWPAIKGIDTRYSLTIHTSRGRIPVWATPAPARHRALGLAPKDFDGVSSTARGEHGGLRPSDALSTPSGNLAQAIRSHWERLSDSGAFASGEDPDAFTVAWHYGTVTAIAALAAATVIGMLV